MSQAAYRRAVLKLSGESFAAPDERGIAMNEVLKIAREIQQAQALGCQMAVVVGGGNILRGAQFMKSQGGEGIKRATSDYMGMLATVINGLALQDSLESIGCDTRLMSAIRMDGVAEKYIRRRAHRHLDKGRIIILAAGTGGPFVTTDTAAALRSLELEADILMKASNVDGIYTSDPNEDPDAVLYRDLDYATAQDKRVMDRSAMAHCRDNDMPVLVFNYTKDGNIQRAIRGEQVGTLVSPDHQEPVKA